MLHFCFSGGSEWSNWRTFSFALGHFIWEWYSRLMIILPCFPYACFKFHMGPWVQVSQILRYFNVILRISDWLLANFWNGWIIVYNGEVCEELPVTAYSHHNGTCNSWQEMEEIETRPSASVCVRLCYFFTSINNSIPGVFIPCTIHQRLDTLILTNTHTQTMHIHLYTLTHLHSPLDSHINTHMPTHIDTTHTLTLSPTHNILNVLAARRTWHWSGCRTPQKKIERTLHCFCNPGVTVRHDSTLTWKWKIIQKLIFDWNEIHETRMNWTVKKGGWVIELTPPVLIILVSWVMSYVLRGRWFLFQRIRFHTSRASSKEWRRREIVWYVLL